MGKRKRISDQTQRDRSFFSSPPSSESMPCSSEMEVLSDKKPSRLGDPGEPRTLSPSLNISDGPMKLLNSPPNLSHHHHQGLGRSIFLKRSQHYYGHQYSRRNSSNASSSCGKDTSRDERLSFKLASQSNLLESGKHFENREKPFYRSERIRPSSLAVNSAVSSDMVKMACGICQKPLSRKLYFLGSSVSYSELYVVAVLVCGHVYHADCLEQRTNHENRRDPPCPLCVGLISQVDDSRGN